MTLLRAVNFEYKMFIVVTICHQLGLNRPVSAASDSLFKGFPSPLHQFGLQFSIIFGTLLLFMLVACRSHFDYIFLVSQLVLLSTIPKIFSVLVGSVRVYPAVFLKYLILFDVTLFCTFFFYLSIHPVL